MATTAEKKETKTPEAKDNYVEVMIPFGMGNRYVCINGDKAWNIPEGKPCKVPPEIAAEVNRSIDAENAYHVLAKHYADNAGKAQE